MPFAFGRSNKTRPVTAKVRRCQPAAIESLESRSLLSANILVTIAGVLPPSEISGQTANAKIGINIANSGPDRVHGRAQLTLFTSVDTTLSSDDSQAVTMPVGLNIPAGHNHTYRLNVKAFPQNLNGNYFILGEVSGANVATTVASSGSTITIIPAEKDLANTLVTGPMFGRISHLIPVTVNVSNSGNVMARGGLPVAFGFSSSPDGSNSFSLGTISRRISLKPGAHTTLHFLVHVPFGSPSGNQYVVADLDPANVFLDPNLTNNVNVSQTPVSVS